MAIPTVFFQSVREFYKQMQPNGYWFEPATIRFFKTKLPAQAYATNAGLLFITSEVNPCGEKRYSVRRQKVTGDIETVGPFHFYPTRQAALAEIKRLHAGATVEA
jgi:hypothetical protein